MNIRKKLFLVNIFILILALLSFAAVTFLEVKKIIIQDTESYLSALTEKHKIFLDFTLEQRISEMMVLSHSPFIINGSEETVLPYLREENKRLPHYDTLFVTDAKGDYYLTSGAKGNLADREYWKYVMAKGEPVVSDPVSARNKPGIIQIVIGAPIKKNGKTIGLMGGTILLDTLTKKIDEIKVAQTGYAFIVQNDGLVIAHPNKKFILNYNPLKDPANPTLNEAIINMSKGEKGIVKYAYNGVEKYVVYSPIPRVKWSLAINIPVKEALNELYSLTYIIFLIAVVIIVIAILILFYFSKSLINPINRLKQELNTLVDKGGDLTQKIRIDSNDETAVLADALNRFIQNIRSIIENVSKSSGNLTHVSEQLEKTAKQTEFSFAQVLDNSILLSNGASMQAAKAKLALAEVVEVKNQITSGNFETEKTVQDAEVASKVAREGKDALNKVINMFSILSGSVKHAADSVHILGQRSEQINSIISAITNISKQTNLLALNAAIESARAGEYGKGFAVVADEVKSLADESGRAAMQITSLIQSIQSETKTTILHMEKSLNVVENQFELIQISNRSLSDIVTQVESTEEKVSKLKGIFSNLMDHSDEVTKSISYITDIIHQSANSTDAVTKLAKDQSKTIEEISNSSSKITNEVGILNKEINKFKFSH
jgi:methyl-accepting chemotaxis protein